MKQSFLKKEKIKSDVFQFSFFLLDLSAEVGFTIEKFRGLYAKEEITGGTSIVVEEPILFSRAYRWPLMKIKGWLQIDPKTEEPPDREADKQRERHTHEFADWKTGNYATTQQL